jgi:hypothetical protein
VCLGARALLVLGLVLFVFLLWWFSSDFRLINWVVFFRLINIPPSFTNIRRFRYFKVDYIHLIVSESTH